MRYYRFLRLFLSFAWSEIEPESCGIPDEYRIKGRISIGLAWKIARDIALE